jgi:SAM-dependent methyltransferase
VGRLTNLQWRYWGRTDPLWGVLTDPNKRGAWTEEEFYRSGAGSWPAYLSLWERYGLDKTACAEIGCGAGRITAQLVNTFHVVHAIDVSEGMIAMARKAVPDATYHLIDGYTIPLGSGSVSAACSVLVFQHLSDAEVRSYFSEIHRILSGGGSMMVQMPFHQFPYAGGVQGKIYEAMRRILSPFNFLAGYVKRMQYRTFGAPDIARRLEAIGFLDVQIVMPMSVVMGRKAETGKVSRGGGASGGSPAAGPG